MSMGITEIEVEEIASDTGDTGDKYNLKALDSSHEHYKRIQADFQEAGIKVLKIEKLQNSALTETYTSSRSLMIKHRSAFNPDYKINEKYLYHGTASSKGLICEQGLDDKLAGRGCFGKGIYFSDNIKKCLKYANRREGDEALILCVRVALGEAKVYEDGDKEPSLAKEPEKKGKIKGIRFYCSVKGRPNQYNEFVVYRKNQAMVEYVITYSKTSAPETKTVTIASEEKPIIPASEEKLIIPASEEKLPESSDSEDDDDYEACSDHSSDDTNPPGSDDDSDASSLSDWFDASEGSIENKSEKEPEEIDPAKKREKFIKETGEKKDSVIDSFLWATANHVDIAIELYLNQDKIEEEMKKLRDTLEAGGIKKTDENGKEITFHPEGYPHYESEAWKQHSESEKESFMEKYLSVFMDAIALGAEHRDFAKGYLQNNKYDIDQTIIAYYSSI